MLKTARWQIARRHLLRRTSKSRATELAWKAFADLESGIAHFIILRDGQQIATVPEKPANPFGRPIFQGLQYSDTPAYPLVKMTFSDNKAEAGKKHDYRVIAVNTAGIAVEVTCAATEAADQ
jgi:hypothetical protein